MTNKVKKISLVSAILVGIVFILVGLFHIYENGKTDGFENGSIKVSDCKVYNYDWKIYTCYGDYTSGAGMITTKNASVRVDGGEYAKGDTIGDVYQADPGALETTHTFITGRDRASVEHNMLWIIFILVGLLLPIGTASYLVGVYIGNKRRSNP